jgi:signal transduction histidine kinase/ligand-binding sensor domain-containing protein
MVNVFRIALFLMLFGVWQPSQAQSNYAYFHTLTVENGLSEASNTYVFKDSRGLVWISSLSGLNCYDGRQVRVYQPDPADSNALFGQNIQSPFFEDKNGNIWFSTYEGINKYVRKDDIFQHYTVKESISQKSLAGYTIAHLDNWEKLWVLVGEQAVYLFDIEKECFIKKHMVTPFSQCLSVQTDSLNSIIRSFAYTWSVGNMGMQMTEYLKNGTIRQENLFTQLDKYPLSITDFLYQKTDIWLATTTGLYRFDPITKDITHHYLEDNITSIESLENNLLLATSLTKGFYVFNTSNRQLQGHFRHSNENNHSLSADNLLNASVDKEGGIWLQVNGFGLNYQMPFKSKFKNIYSFPNTINQKKPFKATALIVDKNDNLFSGSMDEGVKYFEKNNNANNNLFTNEQKNKEFNIPSVLQSFMDKQGRIWFINFNYLGYFNTEKQAFKSILNPIKTTYLYGLTTTLGKNLIATYDGVFELKEINNNNNFKLELIKNIPFDKPHSILFEDNNGLIWGSYDAISIRIYNPNNNFELIKELPINGVITGFWHQPNSSIIWMSSQNGLFKIDKNDYKSTLYTEKNGLSSRTINAMIADNAHHLWLGTSKGLAQFNPSTEKAIGYNLVDGISDLNFNLYAVTKAQDGTIYFGTSNGITAFNPKNITPLSIQAHPTITNILINDQNSKNLICAKTGAKNISEIENLVLPYSQNTISFTFTSLEYSDPMHCQFEYKMEGIDKDWVNSSTQNFARYANINAGNYTFLLKASNSDGIWNNEPKKLQITIVPPFWRTWWFLTLCALFAMALVGYIVYLRLSKVIELQKIRLKLYENLHDDIGSRLTAIVLLVEEILQRDTGNNQQKTPKLPLIGEISRNIVGNMRRLVWATAPENDALESVVQKMHADKRTLLPLGIDIKIVLATELKKMDIAGDKRYQMLSVFNEALTNISKYAQATNVIVSIEKEKDNLKMTIQDNGKGFDTAQPRTEKDNSSGYGLANMRRRANRIKGSFTIESELNKGTIVTLIFPIHDETFWQRVRFFFNT